MLRHGRPEPLTFVPRLCRDSGYCIALRRRGESGPQCPRCDRIEYLVAQAKAGSYTAAAILRRLRR